MSAAIFFCLAVLAVLCMPRSSAIAKLHMRPKQLVLIDMTEMSTLAAINWRARIDKQRLNDLAMELPTLRNTPANDNGATMAIPRPPRVPTFDIILPPPIRDNG